MRNLPEHPEEEQLILEELEEDIQDEYEEHENEQDYPLQVKFMEVYATPESIKELYDTTPDELSDLFDRQETFKLFENGSSSKLTLNYF